MIGYCVNLTVRLSSLSVHNITQPAQTPYFVLSLISLFPIPDEAPVIGSLFVPPRVYNHFFLVPPRYVKYPPLLVFVD